MQLLLHGIRRETLTLTKNSPHPRTTTSFCTTLKGSNLLMPTPSMTWIDSSGNDATRTSPSNTNSMLCGEDAPGGLWAELTAIRLCTETPRAGGSILEKGDEILLRLADDTGSAFLAITPTTLLTHGGFVFTESAPVVIIFTKYDKLLMTKRAELQEDDPTLSEDVLHEKSKEESRKALDRYIQSLERTLNGMGRSKSQPLKAHHVVNVSGITSHYLFNLF